MPTVSEIVSFVSAGAAAFSAIAAWRVSGQMAKSDRERREREVSLLANKIDAAVTDVFELGEQLKRSVTKLFIGTSAEGVFKSDIEKRQKTIKSVQEAVHCLLKDDPTTLCEKQITERLLELDGHHVSVERIRRTLEVQLASVEAESSLGRQLSRLEDIERRLSELSRMNSAGRNFR